MIDAFVVVQVPSKRDMRTENGLHHALSFKKEKAAAANIFIRFGWTAQKLCNCLENRRLTGT